MVFSRETQDFLFENRMQDSRAWFNQHKKEYHQYVMEPLQQLVVDLTPSMLQIDDCFVTEPRVDKTICRIWRDTRYTHDPSLYRETMWIIFKRDRMHTPQYPGLYFEITPDCFYYGGGFYHAPTAAMNALRRMVLTNNPLFLRAEKAFSSQLSFQMEGDCYKRPRYSQEPQNLRQWLERRNISFTAKGTDPALLYSPQLADFLKEEFRMFSPVYQLLLQAALNPEE